MSFDDTIIILLMLIVLIGMALTLAQVANRLQVSARTVRREIDDGRLPAARVRGIMRGFRAGSPPSGKRNGEMICPHDAPGAGHEIVRNSA